MGEYIIICQGLVKKGEKGSIEGHSRGFFLCGHVVAIGQQALR